MLTLLISILSLLFFSRIFHFRRLYSAKEAHTHNDGPFLSVLVQKLQAMMLRDKYITFFQNRTFKTLKAGPFKVS